MCTAQAVSWLAIGMIHRIQYTPIDCTSATMDHLVLVLASAQCFELLCWLVAWQGPTYSIAAAYAE